ncbi:hypothetical protein [Microbacterium oleivorans]|uniref:Uncharacterized protein n=1 Tax=Microbacterium oleivorans TaxID=273677 RepID=A0A7D5IU86_9MICO|nr:hypothetical protein [Microbacterium oleivorans]QLD12957.1 hypothetical protein HW566_14920 [Microbacterium oleivorans]
MSVSPEPVGREISDPDHAGHPGAIAVDLGVMRSIVVAFQSVLARLGDTVYVQPKMGADMWTHREDIA